MILAKCKQTRCLNRIPYQNMPSWPHKMPTIGFTERFNLKWVIDSARSQHGVIRHESELGSKSCVILSWQTDSMKLCLSYLSHFKQKSPMDPATNVPSICRSCSTRQNFCLKGIEKTKNQKVWEPLFYRRRQLYSASTKNASSY